jgi:hypothetical protein
VRTGLGDIALCDSMMKDHMIRKEWRRREKIVFYPSLLTQNIKVLDVLKQEPLVG